MIDAYNISDMRGRILVATPSIADTHFRETVIIICEHNKSGALGFVINRPLKASLQSLFFDERTKDDNKIAAELPTVLEGGPVAKSSGFVLYQHDTPWKGSLNIGNNLLLSSKRDILQAIVDGEGPEKALIMIGYCSWRQDQLENELMQQYWLSVPLHLPLLFDYPREECWRRAGEHIEMDITDCISAVHDN